jgi:enoyl-[acyl-carrier protein] reductase I
LLDGKVALIVGVRNQRSFGWQVAQAFAREGASLAFTCRERSYQRVLPLVSTLGQPELYLCDVQSDDAIARALAALRERHEGLDVVDHSIANAQHEDVSGGRFVDTTRAGFAYALDVSVYSLVALARAAEPLLTARGGGSIIAMSSIGGERVLPGYNVMGVAKAALECSVRYLAHELGPQSIRVNAISAGPVRTLAARSIAGFPTMEAIVEERAPLHRHVTADDVGAAAAYLLSDAARNVTGTTLYVDSGYHAMGM